MEARTAGDMNILIGSLQDNAAACIAWAERLERLKPSIIPA